MALDQPFARTQAALLDKDLAEATVDPEYLAEAAFDSEVRN
jgi:hypothetical protein